jgi:uncharacterized protein
MSRNKSENQRQPPKTTSRQIERPRPTSLELPVLREQVLVTLAKRLEGFAETLTEHERMALSALLDLASANNPLSALAEEPAEALLSQHEIEIYRRLQEEPPSGGAGLRRTMVVVMKATRLCNLRCTYCHFWREGPNQVMDSEVLTRAIRDVLRSPGVQNVDFVWHGGETTLLPITYYRKAIWLQEQFRRPGQKVTNSLQTNGTNITDEWLEFCRLYNVEIGVSLDGPPEVNDRRRVDAHGAPTSERVREGLGKLRAHGLDYGVLMVVDDDVVALGAERVLSYFLEIGVERIGLLNVIPENTPTGESTKGGYIAWPRYVGFLQDLFRMWWPAYKDRIWIRELSDLIGKVQGKKAETCIFDGDCMGGFLTIEPSGDVSACDKYLGDEAYRFGNILRMDLADLSNSHQLKGVRISTGAAVDPLRDCPWFRVCQGGCPHDRYVANRRGVSFEQGCCGLAPLISEIAEKLG